MTQEQKDVLVGKVQELSDLVAAFEVVEVVAPVETPVAPEVPTTDPAPTE